MMQRSSSTRHRRHHRHHRHHLPTRSSLIPTSLTVCNIWPFPKTLANTSTTTTTPFRPEHSLAVLPSSVRLELTVQDDDTVLYHCTHESQSVQLCWNHISESIDDQTLKKTWRTMKQQSQPPDDDDDDDDTILVVVATLYCNDTPFLRLPLDSLVILPRITSYQNLALPLNTVLVTFEGDDGNNNNNNTTMTTTTTIRGTPELLQRLVETQQITPPPPQQHPHQQEASKFEEDVFKTLDQVNTSLDEEARLWEPSIMKMTIPAEDESDDEDDDDTTTSNRDAAENNPMMPETTSQQQLLEELRLVLDELNQETRTLQELLQHEQASLDRDRHELEQRWNIRLGDNPSESSSSSSSSSSLSEPMKDDAVLLERSIANLRRDTQKLHFLWYAQQIRFVKELAVIYPITVNDQRYRIRGLELMATDVGGGATTPTVMIPDDEVVAALGHVAHVVNMLSQYLAVPLRYRIRCQSSRSTMVDDRQQIQPLYSIARNAHPHMAIMWLDRNVDCLCRARLVKVSTKSPLLAKLKRLYDHVMDGY